MAHESQSYGKMLLDKTVMPTSDIPWKDIQLLLRNAEQVNVETPMAKQVLELMRATKRMF